MSLGAHLNPRASNSSTRTAAARVCACVSRHKENSGNERANYGFTLSLAATQRL
jgi:hypothetical protein